MQMLYRVNATEAHYYQAAHGRLPWQVPLMCHLALCKGGADSGAVSDLVEQLQKPFNINGVAPEEATALAEILLDKHACLKCVEMSGDTELTALDGSASDPRFTATQVIAAVVSRAYTPLPPRLLDSAPLPPCLAHL
jgi:hypothetical protein